MEVHKEQSRTCINILAILIVLSSLLPLCKSACTGVLPTAGSDGFQPIFGPRTNQIFTIDHHSPVQIRCSDLNTGTTCTGFPAVPNYGAFTSRGTLTTNILSGPQFYCSDSTNPDCYKLYFPMAIIVLNSVSTQVFNWGISCFNVQTRTLCTGEEFVQLGPNIQNTYTTAGAVSNGIYNLVRLGEKFYSFTGEMQMTCYDLSTRAICPGYPKSFGDSTLPIPNTFLGWPSGIVTRKLEWNGSLRLYAMLAYNNLDDPLNLSSVVVFCYDITNERRCSEWTQNGHVVPTTSVTSWIYDIYFDLNAAGTPLGICFSAAARGCVNFNNPSLSYTPVAFAGSMYHQETYGTKMYYGDFPTAGIKCFDFATHASCSGFPVAPYSGSGDYGATLDPDGNCLFTTGHFGIIYSIGLDGSVPCASVTYPLEARNDVILGVVGENSSSNVFINDKFEDPNSAQLLSGPAGAVLKPNGDFSFSPTALGTYVWNYRVCGTGYAVSFQDRTITVVAHTATCNNIE